MFLLNSPQPTLKIPQNQKNRATVLEGSDDDCCIYYLLSLDLKLVCVHVYFFDNLIGRSSYIHFYSIKHTLIYKHYILQMHSE